MEYWPDPLVTTERVFSMSAGLDASTVTPGMTALEESLTVPTIEAWAWAMAGMATSATRTRIAFTNLSIVTSKVLTALPARCSAAMNQRLPLTFRQGRSFRRLSAASDEMLALRHPGAFGVAVV